MAALPYEAWHQLQAVLTLCSVLIGGHDTIRRNGQYLKKINVSS